MRLGDLTTLGNVRLWLSAQNYVQQNSSSQADITTILQQLISRWSNAILSELERAWILPKTYTNDAYDGNGGNHQFLRNWPVTKVSQLSIGTTIIPAAPIQIGTQPVSPGYGWRLEEWDGVPPGGPQAVELVGTNYYPGKLNVQITYNAGYLVENEAQTIPAPTAPATTSDVTVGQPYGIWAQDMGVTYADGTALTYQSTDPTAAGQYTVIPPDQGSPPAALSPPGVYRFFTGSGGDSGADILISYGFIPSALEQIAIELVCERYLYRGRIGELSRTVAQQVTAKYDNSEFPKYAMPVLQRYRNILPL